MVFVVELLALEHGAVSAPGGAKTAVGVEADIMMSEEEKLEFAEARNYLDTFRTVSTPSELSRHSPSFSLFSVLSVLSLLSLIIVNSSN